MKQRLCVGGMMLMMLSACVALPENELGEVQAASRVVAQSASEVAAPVRVPAAPDVPKTAVADDVKVLPVAPKENEPTSPKKSPEKPQNPKPEKDKTEKNDKTDKADKNTSPAKLNVTLRNQPKPNEPKTSKTAPPKGKIPKAAPVVVVKLPPPPPPKPVLTRRQILEQEITRERAALKSAQSQLAAAQKSGNAKQIAKLNAAVRDRELNVRAIEAEMKR